jgi:uncharacterized cupin superfamily protein
LLENQPLKKPKPQNHGQSGKKKSPLSLELREQETCLNLEGKVQVKTPEGTVEFGKGDWVVFPVGLKCTGT